MATPKMRGYCPAVATRRLLSTYFDYWLAAIIGAVYLAEVSFGADEAGKRGASAAVALLFSSALPSPEAIISDLYLSYKKRRTIGSPLFSVSPRR